MADQGCLKEKRLRIRPCVCQKFSTFQLSQYFDIDQILTVENCPKILPTFDSQKFRKNKSKILPKDQNIPENVRKFRYIFDIFSFSTVSVKNLQLFFDIFDKCLEKTFKICLKKQQIGPNLTILAKQVKQLKNHVQFGSLSLQNIF